MFDRHHPIEVLLGKVDYRAHGGLNSCIVDEAVDLAPQREGACGVAKHLFGVGDVCDTCFEPTGARVGSQTRYLALVPGYGKDVGALRNQALDDGDAQVACGAGNDDVLSGK